MPATDTLTIETADDLLSYLKGRDALAYRYVKLLKRCAEEGYPVGMMEDTVQAQALSDWEAAACIPKRDQEEIAVDDITDRRRKLCRESDLIHEHDHRKGYATYKLNPQLVKVAK